MWWQYIIIAAVILLGIYGFLTFTRFETRFMSRRTDRTVESMYPSHAGSLRKQRRWVQEHGGEPAGDDGGRSPEPTDTQSPGHGQGAAGGPGGGSA